MLGAAAKKPLSLHFGCLTQVHRGDVLWDPMGQGHPCLPAFGRYFARSERWYSHEPLARYVLSCGGNTGLNSLQFNFTKYCVRKPLD